MTTPTRARNRDGWETLGPAGVKGSRYWRHESGVTVRHCGHPTALSPYYVEEPGGRWVGSTTRRTRKGRPIGLTFRVVVEAQAWVERFLWPTVVLVGLPPFERARSGDLIEVDTTWTWRLPADWLFEFPALPKCTTVEVSP